MQRSWRFFNQNFVFGRNKKWKFVRSIYWSIINKLFLLIVQFTINYNDYYSRISALCPEGDCITCFKRVVCISCRPHDLRMWTFTRERGGVDLMWTHVNRGKEPKTRFPCGRHKWMT